MQRWLPVLAGALFWGCSSATVGGATASGSTGRGSSSSSGAATTGGSSGSGASASTSGSGSSAGSSSTGGGSAASTGGTGGSGGATLSSRYPGDVGIDSDPAVVWHEDFEEGSVAAVIARYDDHKNEAGMQLVSDVPPGSSGSASMKLTSHGSQPDATDFFKELPNHDEIWARWYVKYQPGVLWHHTGVWIGGYNPPSSYPNPQAGTQPSGDDHFSVSIEPVFNTGKANPRLDFYNYWMQMHSWSSDPAANPGTAYYGNTLVHQNAFTNDEGQWMCIEDHIKLNTDPSSAAGAVLEAYKNGVLVQHFDESGVLGYWVADKFCPQGADGSECTDYPPSPGTTMIPLDLQWRSTTDLHINAFWPQNYITDGTTSGSVQFDDMVVATERVGCLQ